MTKAELITRNGHIWAMDPTCYAEMLAQAAQEEFTGELTAADKQPVASRFGDLAVVPIHGPIMPKYAAKFGGLSPAAIQKMVKEAAGDPKVEGIILDVDSPGGSAMHIPETAAVIRAAGKEKPVTAMIRGYSASAAYWLTSQADQISLTPSGAAGSIGVFAGHTDLSKWLDKEGLKVTLVTAGKYKAEGNPYQELTKEGRAAMQERVDAIYDDFVSEVATGRGVEEAAVRKGYGQGRMLLAKKALDAGLVDRVETQDQTLIRAVGSITQEAAQQPTTARQFEQFLKAHGFSKSAARAITNQGFKGITAESGGMPDQAAGGMPDNDSFSKGLLESAQRFLQKKS